MFMALRPADGDSSPQEGFTAAHWPRLHIHTVDDPQRAVVEAFISDIFARRYGARLSRFAPILVSLQDATGIVAAAGYRSAATGPLFLERYLGAPVEQVLAPHADGPLPRLGIVEVGHLAAARSGEGRRLIALLGQHLAGQNFQWVVSTLTTELRHLFVRIGVTPLALGTADPAALGPQAQQWGSYYDHCPVVLAGNLRQALAQLARRQTGKADA
jgi:hypothetical protein